VDRAQKEAAVAELRQALSEATCLYLADYRGLTVEEVNALRRKCRDEGVTYRVVKNSLAKLALAGTDKAPLVDVLTGPNGAAWTSGDPASPARVLVDYAKDNNAFEVKEAVVDGRKLTPAEVEQLSKLPSTDVLRAQFLSVLVAPMQQLTSIIAAPMRDIVGVLDAKLTETETETENEEEANG